MIASVFQIAQVTRPLMSVGRICDEGFEVMLTNNTADVRDKNGNSVVSFKRQDGGLYLAKMMLKQPFGRQE